MRSRLALLVAATTSLVLVAMLVPLALLVRATAENNAITQATAEAQSVGAVIGTVDEATLALAVSRAEAAGGHDVAVFPPGARPVSEAVELARRGRSFTAVSPGGGREVLVAVQGPGGTSVVQVVLTPGDLTRGVGETWLGLLLLGVVLIGLGVALADRLAVAITRPMTALARVSHRLAGGDLEARAVPGGPPEVRSAGLALNHLAGRIGELLAEERETVADISHRLRTPLTGLRLEAESLRDPAEADRIAARVDALEKAVTSVILDARRRTREKGSCDAAMVVRERAEFWSVLAEEQERAFSVTVPPGPVEVPVSAPDLAAALDALFENVFAHTDEGVSFSVRLTPRDLVVEDDGPGFGPAALERGHSGAGSTGLGLDIVRRTVPKTRLERSPGGGARVVLTLVTS
ncbi:HAMP domain-containing protein [Herbidospora sp. NEAU-GS84]|uniref:histidine kinase n=1 Tax=Herbidospora solisilvae TaxID=2696284 RepID=A0A7C9J5M7_9ACTN|nr:HAMP domain-containing sensor histidine kinase [Herbidospora solisilvae]NAS24480.1 HAMP domain-containing protein [Herbidospora solisilvae]